jgi:hypothetical protein
LEKERKKRIALMPDKVFEGDFLEVKENIPGIVNTASAVLLLIRSKEKMTFQNESKCIINVCNCKN